MRWMGLSACMEKINAYKMSVGKPIEKDLLRSWNRWGDNIRML
jgi:hypothetical protein